MNFLQKKVDFKKANNKTLSKVASAQNRSKINRQNFKKFY